MSFSFAAIASSASSQEIGTKPGSSLRPLRGLVRFIGVSTRCGLQVFCTRPNAFTQTRPRPGWIASASWHGSIRVAMPFSTRTVIRSGPATQL